MRQFTLSTKIYLWITWTCGFALIVWNLSHLQTDNPMMLAALSILGSLALVLKVLGSTERSHYSFNFLIYGFTAVLLGTPEAVLVIVISNIVEWIWHKMNWVIQLFNIACYVIAMQAAGLVMGWINPSGDLTSLAGVFAIVTGMIVFTVLNHLMVGMIVWLARGENFEQSGMFEPLPLMIDLTLLTLGGSLALVWQFNPDAILLFLIPLYLIYSTLRVPMLERQVETDAKTGLFNHQYFVQHLETELSRANRFDRPLTIIMADLDLLRNINNTYGHLAGDEVLIGVAKILKQNVREYDVVARFGGEEFSILLPETSVEFAYERAEMIRQLIEKTEFVIETSVTPIKVTMSFGIATRENYAQPAKAIIHNADTALYHSKLQGRNRSYIYTDGNYESFLAGVRTQAAPEDLIPGEGAKNQDLSVRAANTRDETVITPPNDRMQEGKEPKPAQTALPEPAKSSMAWPAVGVNVFIGLIFLTAAVLFGILFKIPAQVDWLGLTAFAVIVVVTEWYSVDIYVRNTSISTSAAPILAGTLLFGPLGALVLSLAFALTALIKFRSPFSRFVFNLSNQFLAGMLYTIPLVWLGINFWEINAVLQAVICVLAIFLVYISTTSLIAVGMYLDTNVPIRQIWQEKFSWLGPYYIALGVVAFTLSFGYHSTGVMGLVVIQVPLMLIRWGQKLYIDRTREMVSELREKNQRLERNSTEISRLNEGLLDTLAGLIDLRDPFVLGHSRQVTNYAVMIASGLGVNNKQIELIRKAALLHDVGKLGISERILAKPARLTAGEYNLMKTHPQMGADILEKSSSLIPLIPIVKHHHEHFDGSGYPAGLSGNAIPIEARIVAVADAIEAMASDRPYRKALSHEMIKAELIRNSGTQFDPQMVTIALRLLEPADESVVVNIGLQNLLQDNPPFIIRKLAGD